MSIHERLGREHGLRTEVDSFHRRVRVAGGPAGWSGRDPAVAHDHLDISPRAFDGVVAHLAVTVTQFGVEEEDIAPVGTALTAYRDQIVTASTAAS